MTKQLTPLEALEKIKENMTWQIQLREDCVIVPEFDIVKKHLKALEIIVKKKVDINWLFYMEKVKDYNNVYFNELSQEEFDLLKEVLK